VIDIVGYKVKVGRSPKWGYLKIFLSVYGIQQTRSCAAWCRQPCFSRGVGL